MNEVDDKLLGFDLLVAGVAFEVVAYAGIDAHEAQTSNDALGSVSGEVLGMEYNAFVTTTDLGFIGLAAAGVVLAKAGYKKLFGRSPRQ